MNPPIIIKNPFGPSMEVEVFLRVRGHLPTKDDTDLTKEDYQKFLDTTDYKKGSLIWEYAWSKYKELNK